MLVNRNDEIFFLDYARSHLLDLIRGSNKSVGPQWMRSSRVESWAAMMNLAVLGAQWGDEGKGKIVDLLTPRFDIVARYQGGHNAGHTVYVNGTKFVLRLI